MSKIRSAVSATYPLPDVPLSAVELATFYPHHSIWPEYLLRLFRNGWTMALVAKAQLYARGDLNKTEYTKRANALRKAKKTAGDNKYGVTNFDSSHLPFSGYADLKPFPPTTHTQPWTRQQTGDHLSMYNPVRGAAPFISPASVPLRANHPTLRMVLNGVVNFPAGDDAGPFTKVLLWAGENNHLDDCTTAHIRTIAANPVNVLRDGRSLSTLPAEAFTHTWDQSGAARVVALPRGW